MRSQGYTRPLSVFKIRSTVRSKYARMSKEKMIKMLSLKSKFNVVISIVLVHMIVLFCYIGTDGRVIAAEVPRLAVNKDLLLKVAQWRDQGIGWIDIIGRLQPHTVPTGYTYCPWRPGTEIVVYLF